ncbi:MAG: PEGA domain-containing protein [Spirochaetaceae bacterium]|nr:PEGA domain-containing protein [Spirochaetaceae bacterium]
MKIIRGSLLFACLALVLACSRQPGPAGASGSNPGDAPVAASGEAPAASLPFATAAPAAALAPSSGPAAPRVEPPPFAAPAARAAFEAELLAGAAVADEASAARVELWAASLASSGGLGDAIQRLEAAASAPSAPPAVHFALAALYGRKGLQTKQYEALVKAESAAAARPDIAFNLAVVYGRKETLKAGGKLEDFLPGAVEAASDPPGATVSIDGQVQGASPLLVEGLKAGKHAVRFELAGHESAELAVEVKAGVKTGARATLAALRVLPASLLVETLPPGAAVSLDGGEARTSPALFEELGAGSHRLAISEFQSDDGLYYLGEEDFRVDAKSGERLTLRRELVPAPSRLKVVFCPIGSILTINGVAASEKTPTGSPFFDGEYPAGLVKIRVEAEDFEPWTLELNLKPGQRFTATPGMGRKDYRLPRKTIKIDGKTDDWAGVAAAFTDPAGDSGEKKASGSDLTAAYVCRDDTYLYWRIDLGNGKPAFAVGDKYDLSIGGAQTGFDLEVAREESGRIAQIWSQKAFAMTPVGDYAVGADCIEARFPLSAIKGIYDDKSAVTARFRFWRYKKGTPNTDIDTSYFRGLLFGE